MRRLWQRFLRLCRESEIRLSSSALRLEAVRRGDLLQIGPRLFRVTRRLPEPAGLELEPAEAPSGGRALRVRFSSRDCDPLCPWVLEDEGGALPLASCDVLHFPVATS